MEKLFLKFCNEVKVLNEFVDSSFSQLVMGKTIFGLQLNNILFLVREATTKKLSGPAGEGNGF